MKCIAIESATGQEFPVIYEDKGNIRACQNIWGYLVEGYTSAFIINGQIFYSIVLNTEIEKISSSAFAEYRLQRDKDCMMKNGYELKFLTF